jgi:hypothetical protein
MAGGEEMARISGYHSDAYEGFYFPGYNAV